MYIRGMDLRTMRLTAGLTTLQMSKLAEVKTRKTYENWEKNSGEPNLNQFIAMCLGCSQIPAYIVKQAVERTDPDVPLKYIPVLS